MRQVVLTIALSMSMIPAQENKVSREDYHYLVEGVNRIDVDIEYGLGGEH